MPTPARPLGRLLAAGAALALGVTAFIAPAPQAPASTREPSLSPTPYMGWNNYYGGVPASQKDVLAVAQSMKDRGLQKAGYTILWLDGGWNATPNRTANGDLAVDPERFPDGMKAFTAKLHALGFKAGIYTDGGPQNKACALASGGGNEQRDADTFAEWGFDAVKVDFLCGFEAHTDPKTAMTKMANALHHNASRRPMIVNICNPVTSPWWGDFPADQQSIGSYAYAPKVAESWRTFTDVGFQYSIKYADVLRNYDANAAHPEAAGPGHWSDPDYLGPELGMTADEFTTQLSLWAVGASPLIIGNDPRKLSQATVDQLTDPDLVAIDQDRLGVQGRRIGRAGDHEVWVKPLADGSKAVALVNRSDDSGEVSTSLPKLGLGARASVKNVFTNRRAEAFGRLSATVPAHGTVLFKVSRATGWPAASRVVVTQPHVTEVDGVRLDPATPAGLVGTGSSFTVKVKVRNQGLLPVRAADLAFDAPEGWKLSDPRADAYLAPGESHPFTFRVSVPSATKPGHYRVGLQATSRGRQTGDPVALDVVVAPAAPKGEVNLAHHPWISATSGWLDPTVDKSVGGWTPIVIDSKTYDTGIGVASPSDIRWYLAGTCSRLTGKAGIDDAVKFSDQGATVTFAIVGDGKTLWKSGTVKRDELRQLDVDVTGVRDLHLVIGDAGDTGYNDRADWADLKVSCS